MNVKDAFLHGEVDQGIYMKQPKGFESKEKHENICRLPKALYRLNRC